MHTGDYVITIVQLEDVKILKFGSNLGLFGIVNRKITKVVNNFMRNAHSKNH